MDFFKKNIKFIIIYIAIIILLLIEFPYYIEAPGGIIDINERISIEDSYKSSGSFNLSYVSEYNATLITLIMSLFNNVNVETGAIKSMMIIAIFVYFIYNAISYFIGNKLLNKGVNVD